MNYYPKLEINLNKLSYNIKKVKEECQKQGVEVAGVIKGFDGDINIVKEYEKQNIPFLASARLEHLKPLKGKVKAKLMTIRIPMLSEIEDVIEYTDISLNSELSVLKKLNEVAKEKGKIHEVILMKDLGDLREGFYKDDDIIETAKYAEEASNLYLLGTGTNLGCYGSIRATKEKLEELVTITEKIEKEIGRKLDYISGGSSTSLERIEKKDIPERINMLRIGEGIILGNGLPGLYEDVFTLKCEVIEVKDKPSYPEGEITLDAFGHKVEYIDRGIRKRALLAIGKVDYAYIDDLKIDLEGASIIGASSDHTIVDIEDVKEEIKVGDIINIYPKYGPLVFSSISSNIKKEYIYEEKLK